MKTSARNQFFGKITAVNVGAVNAEVAVGLKGGQSIVAAITKESVEKLGVKVGGDAVALVKAPQVIVVTDDAGYRLSARNQLSGTVSRIHKGAVNSDVIIDLGGGETVAATITNDSLEALGLAEGQTAMAVFKAGSVILGVAA
ncbi:MULTISPECIES: TOBE domain-containing protein [Methylococcus]|uniref:TOBE domain-containing protein n=1 Tax=Methylococcus TaxID=413 RepID=UPI001C533416|nr:TOBE domain-containing protein [Methylococcus capsulatus]QXP87913.1 TOBE domain-containing protein [Methylococcus capsulatus]QXP90732.1 TOBE domain-containing protein [Methylococcus capsulatus]QXP92347.1 TOBE domain-containing protein [Methylococcus capsulatus]UQN12937.1 TOBE domain-containing protein [Methylococcus capsulatus]